MRVNHDKKVIEGNMTVGELAYLMMAKFDTMSARFDSLSAQVADLREEMHFEFIAIDERFNRMDEKIDGVERRLSDRMDGVDMRIGTMDARHTKDMARLDKGIKQITNDTVRRYEFEALEARLA